MEYAEKQLREEAAQRKAYEQEREKWVQDSMKPKSNHDWSNWQSYEGPGTLEYANKQAEEASAQGNPIEQQREKAKREFDSMRRPGFNAYQDWSN